MLTLWACFELEAKLKHVVHFNPSKRWHFKIGIRKNSSDNKCRTFLTKTKTKSLSPQGENADENEAVLDEEMEKVFSEPNLSKFDVRKLSDVKPPSSTKLDKLYEQSQQAAHSAHKYNEQDYDSKLTSMVPEEALL